MPLNCLSDWSYRQSDSPNIVTFVDLHCQSVHSTICICDSRDLTITTKMIMVLTIQEKANFDELVESHFTIKKASKTKTNIFVFLHDNTMKKEVKPRGQA